MKLTREVTAILGLQVILSVCFVWLTKDYVESLRLIRLTQWFGFSSAISLYLYLFLEGLKIDFKEHLKLPILVFLLLHSGIAFFGEIGGLEGLSFLPHAFLVGVAIGFVAFLAIVSILGYSLFKKIPQKLQNAVTIVFQCFILLTLIHVLIVGSHYLSYKSEVFRLSFISVASLILLKSYMLDGYLTKKLSLKNIPIVMIVVSCIGGIFVSRIFSANPDQMLPTINMHAESMSADMQMDTGAQVSPMLAMMNSLPTMKGDRTKRFTVSFDHSEQIKANTDTTFRFKIYDAASGIAVGLFQLDYTKLMHLVIVDQDLNFFTHIHPDQKAETFEITTKLPKDGIYHAYVSFQPIGAIEQQFGFTFTVGSESKTVKKWQADSSMVKTFGNIEVTLTDPKLIASKMTKGEQTLRFSLKDMKTNQPVTNLFPYLAAFGHLVMINTQTYEYLHVHPTNITAPKPEDRGGPIVEFIPMSVFDPIHPGIYRVFAQLNPEGHLLISDFTVNVQ